MTKNNWLETTGGWAFPVPGPEIASAGMTLLDYFAGQALAGMLADHTCDVNASEAANGAYRYAEAMLAERARLAGGGGMRDTCKGCGKPIHWAISQTGAKIPIDLAPTIYFLEPHGETDNPPLRAIPMPPHLQLVHGISHFVNCPKANEFSGKNKQKDHS